MKCSFCFDAVFLRYIAIGLLCFTGVFGEIYRFMSLLQYSTDSAYFVYFKPLRRPLKPGFHYDINTCIRTTVVRTSTTQAWVPEHACMYVLFVLVLTVLCVSWLPFTCASCTCCWQSQYGYASRLVLTRLYQALKSILKFFVSIFQTHFSCYYSCRRAFIGQLKNLKRLAFLLEFFTQRMP